MEVNGGQNGLTAQPAPQPDPPLFTDEFPGALPEKKRRRFWFDLV